MSRKIYDAMTEHFKLRMQNWARVQSGAGVYATSSVISMMRGTGYGRAASPVQIGEAEDTDRALRELPIRYRSAVSLFWQYQDRPLVWLARRTGLKAVDYRTYENRVIHGHDLLRAVLQRHREQAEEYRRMLRDHLQEKKS